MTQDAPVHLILGGTGGIGSALCRRLAESGARVVAPGRDVVDATSVDAVDALVADTLAAEGRLDGVANCVGSVFLKPAHLTTEAEFDDVLRVNLKSAFAAVRAAGRHLAKNGGSVVLVSTAAARVGLSNHEAVAAAKAGVIGLTLSAAATYAPRKIRFNAVAPGLTRTAATERIWGNEAAAKASVAMHALGRFGEPEDVASAIAWLLDPAQSWVTGQVLGVDGGLGSVRPR
jgi:NAD(P)-dependent dehydrogenase (short-subunit alcohol dehydrogenase family)